MGGKWIETLKEISPSVGVGKMVTPVPVSLSLARIAAPCSDSRGLNAQRPAIRYQGPHVGAGCRALRCRLWGLIEVT
jgi:hypothetical protein